VQHTAGQAQTEIRGMLAIHGIWADGALLLWAEDATRPAPAPAARPGTAEARLRPGAAARAGVKETRPHPGAASSCLHILP